MKVSIIMHVYCFLTNELENLVPTLFTEINVVNMIYYSRKLGALLF
jgi:hypothetical protein